MRAHRTRKRQIEYDGKKFDNPGEVERYQLLMLRYRAGEITLPDVHPKYDIVINGIKVGEFKPDFRYFDIKRSTLVRVVEDCKPGYWKKKRSTRKGVVVREWKERAMIDDQAWSFRKKVIEAACAIVITEIWK